MIDEKFSKIFQEVLEKIAPSEEENLQRKEIAKEIIRKINDFGYNAEIVGSLAKNTNLKDDFDIDIFVKFPPGTDKKILGEKVIEIGMKILENPEVDYAEHPYIKGKFKNYDIEIVPCYDFGNEIFGKFKSIATAVDRTLYHTKFVKEEIEKNKNLRNEILLLKKFLKGINVYGAEGKIRGFSGYLAELLIIYYGSFLNLLKNASSWKYNEFIDIKNYWKGKGKILFKDPLVVIDPVDDTRNVASAVSEENLAKFIFYSRLFLENPSIKFFENIEEEEEIKTEELINLMKERGTKFLSVVFNHGKINLNNLYTQLEKTRKALIKSIERYEFKILNSAIMSNEKNLSII
ncbi:MAG: CCA tRNA nucleotidyltransferase, partial [Candidatus Altarchaeaceae archaeon]